MKTAQNLYTKFQKHKKEAINNGKNAQKRPKIPHKMRTQSFKNAKKKRQTTAKTDKKDAQKWCGGGVKSILGLFRVFRVRKTFFV